MSTIALSAAGKHTKHPREYRKGKWRMRERWYHIENRKDDRSLIFDISHLVVPDENGELHRVDAQRLRMPGATANAKHAASREEEATFRHLANRMLTWGHPSLRVLGNAAVVAPPPTPPLSLLHCKVPIGPPLRGSRSADQWNVLGQPLHHTLNGSFDGFAGRRPGHGIFYF